MATMAKGVQRNWRRILFAIALSFESGFVPIVSAAQVLSADQIASFHRDGYLFTKGLLPMDRIDTLAAAVKEVTKANPQQHAGGYFSLLQSGGIFLPHPNSTTSSNVYQDVAIHSSLPSAVAELMQLDAERGDNLRLLRFVKNFVSKLYSLIDQFISLLCFRRRDITMVKDVQQMKTCDWHVDDVGFWPVSYLDTSGINVWIALDDMPYGGNMALAPKSHVAPWRHEAYLIIGQNRSRPHGLTKEETRASVRAEASQRYLTCDMHLVNATLRDEIEATAVYMDSVQKGDIIFASRLLFHRTMRVSDEGLAYYASTQTTNLHRYSLRYEPGTAAINAGWNVEWSVLHDPTNAGRTLNDIAKVHSDYTFYPQVWPVPETGAGMLRVQESAARWMAQAKQEIYETLFATDTKVPETEIIVESSG
jgi:Phytanoyl-CoA dioxygenase (PhyH)